MMEGIDRVIELLESIKALMFIGLLALGGIIGVLFASKK